MGERRENKSSVRQNKQTVWGVAKKRALAKETANELKPWSPSMFNLRQSIAKISFAVQMVVLFNTVKSRKRKKRNFRIVVTVHSRQLTGQAVKLSKEHGQLCGVV